MILSKIYMSVTNSVNTAFTRNTKIKILNIVKGISIFGLFILMLSCGGVKNTQEALNTGNYYSAINKSVAKLSENKTRKGNQDYIYMLEDAFVKNTKRELKEIDFLKKDGNPANYEKIYNLYNRLNSVQERITPLLPLQLYDENRNASFSFKDYSNDILSSKSKLSDYLYNNATTLLTSAITKYDFRKAYDDFKYLSKLSPDYKDVREKTEEAYQKGIDFVQVRLSNNTDKIIPEDLESSLLNFNTYDLDNLWTRYHTNPQRDIHYNYEMLLDFTAINISPEHVVTKVTTEEKEIKDGWRYVLDENGNVAKDSLNNDIKEDKFIVVKCDFRKFTQHKDVQIAGNVTYYDLKTKQQINSYPLTSGFVFEHIYANYNGDKRALDDKLIRLANRRPVPFPSNEQLIYDSGEDLKNNIKSIIKKYQFN